MEMKRFGDRRVLVVDDEPSVRSLVERFLDGRCTVIQASDGGEAINIARSQKPDVILMDIFLPKMDGYAACHIIKKDEVTREVPIVMLTAVGYELNKMFAKELGADGYITKPFSLRVLLDAIDRFLERPE